MLHCHYLQSWRRLHWMSFTISIACIEFWVHRIIFASNYFCFFFAICIYWSTHRDWFFNNNNNNNLLALRNEYYIHALFGFIQWKIFFEWSFWSLNWFFFFSILYWVLHKKMLNYLLLLLENYSSFLFLNSSNNNSFSFFKFLLLYVYIFFLDINYFFFIVNLLNKFKFSGSFRETTIMEGRSTY